MSRRRGDPARARWVVVALLLAMLVLPAVAVAGTAADDALRERIERQVAPIHAPDASEIRVAVRDGRVVLQGRVRLLDQSLEAERLAWTTDGVVDVDNEIRVVPLDGAAEDGVIERRVREAIKGDERFIDAELKLEVVGGLVRLRGTFQDPADVLALKHRIARVPGVLEVEMDAVLLARRGVGTRPV